MFLNKFKKSIFEQKNTMSLFHLKQKIGITNIREKREVVLPIELPPVDATDQIHSENDTGNNIFSKFFFHYI